MHKGIVHGIEDAVLAHGAYRAQQRLRSVEAARRDENVTPDVFGKPLLELSAALGSHDVPLIQTAKEIWKRFTEVSQNQCGLGECVEDPGVDDTERMSARLDPPGPGSTGQFGVSRVYFAESKEGSCTCR